MATIINNPPPNESSGSTGMLVTAIILIGTVFLFIYYLLPTIRQMAQPRTPTINIPDQVDINVNQPDSQTE